MKLRDKTTGAILDDCRISLKNKWGAMAYDTPKTLKELNERFEDVEEPKSTIKNVWFNSVLADGHFVEIDFISDEEAIKAVEKLKAWQRLEDKGFRFKGWSGASGSNNQVVYCDFGKADVSLLNLLFGGEE